MAQKRIAVIANKNWEAAVLMNVLLDSKACPERFPWPIKLNHPVPPQMGWTNPQPRAVFRFQWTDQGIRNDVLVEVWCIQDAMDPSVSSSSTKEKMRVLPRIFVGQSPKVAAADFVVAFGTAGFPSEVSRNGCVAVGASAFIHDPFRESANEGDGYWHSDRTGQVLLPTPLSASLFDSRNNVFDELSKSQIEARLIAPPMNPAAQARVIAASGYAAVGVVNITNYDDYEWADEKALHAFEATAEAVEGKVEIGSLETTHGIIRLQAEAPFIFVSGITDRIGHFNLDVGLRPYAQNFTCAHNAGVTTAWLIPQLVKHLSTEG